VDWSYIEGKGRGVIARQACAAGTEVERSPVIIVPASHLLEKDEGLTVLEEYLLYWSEEEGRELAMGEGLLMIYNHSSDPNVEFETGPEPDTMSVIALRDISAGEELTYDYGVALWFQAASDS
jgi:SET domain-containing protein